MTLLDIVILFIVIGVVWYLLQYVPMPAPLRTVLIAVLAIILIVWILQVTGVGNLRILGR